MRKKVVSRWILVIGLLGLRIPVLYGQNAAVLQRIEAEEGELSGVTISTEIPGYQGTGYVTNFDNENDYVEVEFFSQSTELLQLSIRYRSASGTKTQFLIINNKNTYPIHFDQTDINEFAEVSAGKYLFRQGENKIRIQSSWGYMDVDQFIIKEVIPNEFNIATVLVDPLADQEAVGLYDFLVSNFGKVIISGQTDDVYDKIVPMTNYQPLLRSFDFSSFTEGYPYGWADGDFAFEAIDYGQVDDAIAWYEQTGQQGLVNFHWHWCSPSGGSPGVNTFYTEYTDFDVSLAVTPGTQEYDEVIRDIDTIAVQLLKLQSAGVPVLWRPLHEAGGAWFWWGAKGSKPCLDLYNLMYDRLQNHHGLHNLIWVWSTPEPDWYPGNDKVDILGYDSYPGEYNYVPQKQMFDRLYELSNGEKILAMTENGPLPDIADCFAIDAPWSFFMSWSDLVFSHNTTDHIVDTYSHHQVMSFNPNYEIVLPPFVDPVLGFSDFNLSHRAFAYPNPTQGLLHFSESNIDHIELIDLEGRAVLVQSHVENMLDLRDVPEGIYMLRVRLSHQNKSIKIVVQR